MYNNLAVISLGGSIIAPDKVDHAFLKELNSALKTYLKEDKSRKIILVCGGGARPVSTRMPCGKSTRMSIVKNLIGLELEQHISMGSCSKLCSTNSAPII